MSVKMPGTASGRILMFTGSLTVVAVAAYALVLTILALGQTGFMYPAPAGGVRPALRGWRMVRIPSPDGGLVAYHVPARPGRPTVMFLHGNGTGYDGSAIATRAFVDRGMGVVVPEYPGYGGNPGSPSERSIDVAADDAYDWMTGHGIAPSMIVLYGNSVGSGPAVHVGRRPHAALIIVSGVASMVGVVRHHYPMARGFLVRDRWENADGMAHVTGPRLVMHARDDAVVPFGNGVRLASAARTTLVALPTGDHYIAFDPKVSAWLAEWTWKNIHS